MTSRRESILAALFARLSANIGATVRRNEALPERVPAEGLVIMRDGSPGEPDVTLNPRTEFYSHQVEIEVYVPRAADGSGEVALDTLLRDIGRALNADPSLGGLAENILPSAPEITSVAIDGAAPIVAARLAVTVEYLVTDPLTD